MKNTFRLYTVILGILISFVAVGQGELIFDDSYVHEVRITFDNVDFWSELSQNYLNNYPDVPYSMASASIDGEVTDSVGIRQKGFASHFGSQGDKKSMKIDFNHFVDGKKYDGLKKINLNNGFGDPAIQRDKLCYNIMNKSGVDAPRTSYARIYLNNQYWGLYLLVEQVDRTFLKDNFGNSNGNLFKNVGNSELEWMGQDISQYQQIFELKTDSNVEAWENFVELMDVLNNTGDGDFKEEISKIFDVDLYLKALAVDVATGNWDSYIEHGRNFYMYQDADSRKFNWIPWDYNFALGGTFGSDFGGPGGGGDTIEDPANCATILDGSCPYPATDSTFQLVINQDPFCCNSSWDGVCQTAYDDIVNGVNGGGGPDEGNPISNTLSEFPVDMSNSEKVLVNRLLAVPEYKERYYQGFCRLLDDNFTTERIFPLIEQYGDLIREDVLADPNYEWTAEQFEADLDQGDQISGLKWVFEGQVASLTTQLNELFDCSSIVTTLSPLDVSINEFMAVNDSLSTIKDPAGETDDWIELYNNTDADIDLSNAFLSDNSDNPEKWQFPVGTTIRANDYMIIWADKDEDQEGLHADFKLNRDGDFIMLTEGTDVIDSLTFGFQENNLTYSRIPNGTGDYLIKDPTFGYNNEQETAVIDEYVGEIKVYPNPATQYIDVDLEKLPKAGATVTLTNGIGQTLSTTKMSSRFIRIDLNNLNGGIFLVTIQDEESRTIKTEKVIVFK
ncbi:MAG: CotH kinase family protein [Saprospiraceae bacterium]|nr:CotH kinase family protein [Saprospiraceae bacterium]